MFKLTTASGRTIRTTGNHPYLAKEGWRKDIELLVGQKIAVPKSMSFSMGMMLNIESYPYSNAENQGSNEHCQGHFDSPPFLGCNRSAEINSTKHVTQRTTFTNAEKGLKNSLAIPSTNIALPRSAINFATKAWYFSPISSIMEQLYHIVTFCQARNFAYAEVAVPEFSTQHLELIEGERACRGGLNLPYTTVFGHSTYTIWR